MNIAKLKTELTGDPLTSGEDRLPIQRILTEQLIDI